MLGGSQLYHLFGVLNMKTVLELVYGHLNSGSSRSSHGLLCVVGSAKLLRCTKLRMVCEAYCQTA